MTCPRCSYRVKFGFAPWEDCDECRVHAKIRAMLEAGTQEQPIQSITYQPRWRKPYVYEVPPSRYTWQKPRIWWPMRERAERFNYREALGVDEAKRQGEHWPDHSHELPYGLFEDMELSFEMRAKAREQYETAAFSMPDDDWVPDPPSLRTRGRLRKYKL